jgi:hypothetical protein
VHRRPIFRPSAAPFGSHRLRCPPPPPLRTCQEMFRRPMEGGSRGRGPRKLEAFPTTTTTGEKNAACRPTYASSTLRGEVFVTNSRWASPGGMDGPYAGGFGIPWGGGSSFGITVRRSTTRHCHAAARAALDTLVRDRPENFRQTRFGEGLSLEDGGEFHCSASSRRPSPARTLGKTGSKKRHVDEKVISVGRSMGERRFVGG